MTAEEKHGLRNSAACRTEDPELFFPIGTSESALAQIEEAKAVCGRCTVRDACLLFALETGQAYGVWGGTSEEERASMRTADVRARSGGRSTNYTWQ